MGGSCHRFTSSCGQRDLRPSLPPISEFADCGVRDHLPLRVVGEGVGDPSPRGRPPGGRAPAQSPGVLALAGLWEQKHRGARITPRRQDFSHFPFPTCRSRFLFSGWKMDDFIISGTQQSIWEFGLKRALPLLLTVIHHV